MDGALSNCGRGRGRCRGRRQELLSTAWPPHLRSLGQLLAAVKSGPFADGLNAATHRPDSLGWGRVEDLGADVMAGVRRVKSQDGTDLIVWGSSTLTSVLLEQGLVDEVVLFVYPVWLGRGKLFFSDSAAPCELALVSIKATPSGVLINTYRRVGALRTK